MKLKQHQKYLQELLDTENERMRKLHQIVADAIHEEELLTETLSNEKGRKSVKFSERVADRVASFGGSWRFIILFCLFLVLWVIINAIVLLSRAFDPYPFTLMNVLLSLIAALQAPIIMMSQNRQIQKDRERAENQYLINLKAEIEVRNLHQKMDLLMEDQVKNLLEIQKVQMDLIEKLYVKMDKIVKASSSQGAKDAGENKPD